MRQTPYPRRVLVDSGATLARMDAAETDHQAARSIQAQLIQHRSHLFTSNFLTDETYTLLLVRLGYRFAIQFLDELRASSITVVRITPTDEERAEQILRQYTDKRFSYTDATSFALIERLELDAAFTFDHNFTEYGRITVLEP